MRDAQVTSDHVHTLTCLAPNHAAQWVSQHLVQGHGNGLLAACNRANLEEKLTELIRAKMTEHLQQRYVVTLISHTRSFRILLPFHVRVVRCDLVYRYATSKQWRNSELYYCGVLTIFKFECMKLLITRKLCNTVSVKENIIILMAFLNTFIREVILFATLKRPSLNDVSLSGHGSTCMDGGQNEAKLPAYVSWQLSLV